MVAWQEGVEILRTGQSVASESRFFPTIRTFHLGDILNTFQRKFLKSDISSCSGKKKKAYV
jgi:hypothetical protein